MRKPRIRFTDRGNCYLGEVDMPLNGGGRVTVSALGEVGAPWNALKRAGAAAFRIATDPALAPFIPPQALLAAKAAHTIARGVESNINAMKRAAPQMRGASKTLTRSLIRASKRAAMNPDAAIVPPRPFVEIPPQYPEPQYPEPYPEQYPQEQPGMPQPYMNAEDPNEQAALDAWGPEAFPEQERFGHDEYDAFAAQFADQQDSYAEPMPNWGGGYDDDPQPPFVVQEDVWDDAES